ncbi:hypothetical protein [Lewinella sp. 4G2]|uniref:hypothetical protein n=1 Tax=Lewinella sp. 4G2 TaxID=1803372 RepID=UPI0007B4BDF2|nr:hypothetical protein [Lewinella sp. 4G2]OAV45060.1 hypothetical protein A3850_011430 [Lewinella sp. 4G2]
MANNDIIDINFAKFCSENKEILNSFMHYFTVQTDGITELMNLVASGIDKHYDPVESWRGFVLYKNYVIKDGGIISVDIIFNLTGIEVNIWSREKSKYSEIILSRLRNNTGMKNTFDGRLLFIDSKDFEITSPQNLIIRKISEAFDLVANAIKEL